MTHDPSNDRPSIDELKAVAQPPEHIARYNAGGCNTNVAPDGSTIQFSANIPNFRKMTGYWLGCNSADPASVGTRGRDRIPLDDSRWASPFDVSLDHDSGERCGCQRASG